ncbi:hypothetical protein ACFL6Y_04300 [Elusimicrobiota bacterium]
MNKKINTACLFWIGIIPTVIYVITRIGILRDDGYLKIAKALLQYGSFGMPPSAYHMPGYPLFQAFLLSMLPEKYLILANIAFFVLASAIFFALLRYARITLRVWSGMLVLFLWFFNPFFLFLHRWPMSENPFIPLFMVAIFFYWKYLDEGCLRDIIVSMGVLAFAAYIRSYVLYLPIFLGLPILVYRKNIRHYVLGCSLFLLILSPWWVRNYIQFEHIILTTSRTAHGIWTATNSYILYERPDYTGQWQSLSIILRSTNNIKLKKDIRAWMDIRHNRDSPTSERFARDRVLEFYKNNMWHVPWLFLQRLKWFWHYSGRHPSNRTWYYDLLGVAWYLVWMPFAFIYLRSNPDPHFRAIFITVAIYFSLIAMVSLGSVRMRMPMEFMLIMMFIQGIPLVLRRLLL